MGWIGKHSQSLYVCCHSSVCVCMGGGFYSSRIVLVLGVGGLYHGSRIVSTFLLVASSLFSLRFVLSCLWGAGLFAGLEIFREYSRVGCWLFDCLNV